MEKNSWHVARCTKKNILQLSELRKLQYGDTEFYRPEYIRWQLEENPAGRAVSWVGLDSESNVLGEYWIVPAKVKIQKDTYLGSIGANALVHPDHRRKKLFVLLADKCVNDCIKESIQFTLCVPNRRSIYWREGALIRQINGIDLGAIPLLIHPIDMDKLAEYQFRNKWAKRCAAGVMRNFYRLAMCVRRPRPQNIPLKIVNTSSFNQDFDFFWQRVKDKYSCIVVRDSDYMNWRYVPIPPRKYEILFAKAENRILGYIISRSATILGLKTGIIMDFLFESSDLGWAAGHSLIDVVIEKYRTEGTALVCSLSLPHAEEYHILKNHGFFVCPERLRPYQFHLVVQFHDQSLKGKSLDRLNYWYWSLGDFDAL